MSRKPVRHMQRRLKNRRMMVVQYSDGSISIHAKKLIRDYDGKLRVSTDRFGMSLEAVQSLVPVFMDVAKFDTEDNNDAP